MIWSRFVSICAFLFVAWSIVAQLGTLHAQTAVSFNREIRPILAKKCLVCHGRDEENRKADLRLDVRDEAIASGLYWGAVGAIRALIQQLNKDMTAEPFVVLTGGAAKQVADLLEIPAVYEEHLVLAGLVIAASA